MGFSDIFLGPLYLILVFLIASRLKSRLVLDEYDSEMYNKILAYKIFGVTFFAFIYQFYYEGGDTYGFYSWTRHLVSYFFSDTSHAIKFIFTDDSFEFAKFKYSNFGSNYSYLLKEGTRELFFIKIMFFVNILGFNSYLAISYILTLGVFTANWLLYKTFALRFPEAKNSLVWSVLLIPSVAFWGGGVLKDTIAFIGICFVVYCFDQIFMQKKKRIRNIIFFIIFTYLIVAIRGFVVLSLLPALVVWLFSTFKENISGGFMKFVSTPFLILISLGIVFVLLQAVGGELDRFSINELDTTIKDFQGWHEVASADGSGYSLHTSGSGPLQMLTALPAAVNVTFFRPYLWEVSGAVVLLSALEALFFFLYFLKVFLFEGKIFGFFKVIMNDPLVQLCLVFSILYGFSVGFTSYNFGALSRYKIPAMPFFASMLVLISYRLKHPKTN